MSEHNTLTAVEREAAAPCPWCGQTDCLYLYWSDDDAAKNEGYQTVCCGRCSVEGPTTSVGDFDYTRACRETAIRAWSARAPESPHALTGVSPWEPNNG